MTQRKREAVSQCQVPWKGHVLVQQCLNDTKYVLQKTPKSKSFVVRVACMCRLPKGLTAEEVVNNPHTLPTVNTISCKRQLATTDNKGTGKSAKLSQTASLTDSSESAKPNNLAQPATVTHHTLAMLSVTSVMLVASLGPTW